MARRRYVSTNISIDPRINRLVVEHGDFAALLYTWMIPHAEDDGSLPGDPEQLMFSVIPGQRHRTTEEVAAAVTGMVALGLLHCDGDRIRFPGESFYRYQTYVTEQRRIGKLGAPSLETAQISANQRKSENCADIATSSSSSSSSSFPVSSPVSVTDAVGAVAPQAEREPVRESTPDEPAVTPRTKLEPFLTEEERLKLHAEFDSSLGSTEVADWIEHALTHVAARKIRGQSWFRYVRLTWLKRESEKQEEKRARGGGARGRTTSADSGRNLAPAGSAATRGASNSSIDPGARDPRELRKLGLGP